jgi:hypothetical protein
MVKTYRLDGCLKGKRSVRDRALLSLLTSQLSRQVLQALVLPHLDDCPIVWSCAAKKDMGQLQFVQNKAARISLRCTWRESVSNMHVSLSFLNVEERLTATLLVFVRGVMKMNVMKVPNCLFKQLAQSSDTNRYNTRGATRGLFTVSRSRIEAGKHSIKCHHR